MAEGVCGTGGWTGPLPGDPNTDSILTATAVYGGVQLAWTYPTINPHAVAHTFLYRGVSILSGDAILLATVTGDKYFDIVNPEEATSYYYWIKIVSVYGTIGPLIGPASVLAVPTTSQIMQLLTDQIDTGWLATSLKADIASIADLGAQLALEATNRITGDSAIGLALADVQLETGELSGYLFDEIQARTTADSAQIDQINLLSLNSSTNAAAIATEASVRLSNDQALASQITTAESTLNGNIAQVQTNLNTEISTTNGKITALGALYTVKVNVNGLIGGFGIYNNGLTVQMGFDVDSFWVGRTGVDQVKPFVISGGVVYINKARIKDGDIDSAKIGTAVVNTLHIGTNAVTLPVTANNTGLYAGTGAYFTSVQATMPAASVQQTVLITWFGYHGYSSGVKTTGWRIKKGSTIVFETGSISAAFVVNPSASVTVVLAANESTTFYVEWFGQDSTVGLGAQTLTLLGVKR